MNEAEIRVPCLCPFDHDCVVCGERTLERDRHGARGSIDAKECAWYFNVRCDRCRRDGKLPDPALYKPWFELNEIETISHRAGDGRKIFFEVM